jgi:Fe-S-cluster containining protein
MGTDCNICSNKCWGVENYHGSCCSIEDRNWIIGPHYDTSEFLSRLENKFGRKILYNEVFIDYEEGKNIFPNKSVWQDPKHYPCLRLNFESQTKSCIFYNNSIRACSIYEIRPTICQNYECEYLEEQTKLTS